MNIFEPVDRPSIEDAAHRAEEDGVVDFVIVHQQEQACTRALHHIALSWLVGVFRVAESMRTVRAPIVVRSCGPTLSSRFQAIFLAEIKLNNASVGLTEERALTEEAQDLAIL